MKNSPNTPQTNPSKGIKTATQPKAGENHATNQNGSNTIPQQSTGEDSMRNSQNQINRMDQAGNPLTSRLGQQNRSQTPGKMEGGIGKKAKSYAKAKAIGAIAGTIGLSGGVTGWILFS